MPEAVATLAPSGAARVEDWIFPGRLNAGSSTGLAPQATSRNGAASLLGTTAGIGGGTVPVVDLRLGVPAVRMFCDAVNGVAFQCYPPMGIFVRTTKSNILPAVDDTAVTRIIWSFCGSGVAPNAGSDFGLEISQMGGAALVRRILVDAQAGFGFRLADANTLQWIVRGGNGLVTLNITANPFDLTVWHVIDMWISSATATADATIDVRLDGTPVNLGPLNSSWAAGTNLPPAALLGGVIGFAPQLIANPNPINQFWTYQLRCIRAPSVAATL